MPVKGGASAVGLVLERPHLYFILWRDGSALDGVHGEQVALHGVPPVVCAERGGHGVLRCLRDRLAPVSHQRLRIAAAPIDTSVTDSPKFPGRGRGTHWRRGGGSGTDP